MDRVAVVMRGDELRAGRFPDVCAVTGTPSESRLARFVDSGAVVWGAFLLILPFGRIAYARMVRNRRITYRLPLTHLEAARMGTRDRTHRIARVVMILVGAVLVICVLASFESVFDGVPLARAGVVAIPAVLFAIAVGWFAGSRDPLRFRQRGDQVHFVAHPAFAEAIARRPAGSVGQGTYGVGAGQPVTAPVVSPFRPSTTGPYVPPVNVSLPAWGASPTGVAPGPVPSPAVPSPAVPAVPSPAVPAVPASWVRDPSGRFAYRWWDGSAWTAVVVDSSGQQSIDR